MRPNGNADGALYRRPGAWARYASDARDRGRGRSRRVTPHGSRVPQGLHRWSLHSRVRNERAARPELGPSAERTDPRPPRGSRPLEAQGATRPRRRYGVQESAWCANEADMTSPACGFFIKMWIPPYSQARMSSLKLSLPAQRPRRSSARRGRGPSESQARAPRHPRLGPPCANHGAASLCWRAGAREHRDAP